MPNWSCEKHQFFAKYYSSKGSPEALKWLYQLNVDLAQSKDCRISINYLLPSDANKEEKRMLQEEKAKQQKQVEVERNLSREASLPPQAMYLQAGKYDRSGQQSDAIRLYELLIEKFPSSPLAVQATNRLVAIQADEKASNSSKPSNTICSHLYIGKAVSYKGCGALWCTTVEGVITGIGDGVATMRVTGSEYNGDVIEKSCSKF